MGSSQNQDSETEAAASDGSTADGIRKKPAFVPSRTCIIVAVVVGLLLAVLTSSILKARKSLQLKQAHHKLKRIGMALHQYHDEHGSFPPAVVYDENGNRLHSWRSLIQRHLAAGGGADPARNAYRLSEPWNSPHNRRASRDDRFNPAEYSILAIVGSGAAWRSHGTRESREFTDGTPQTILLLAVRNAGIGWHEPRDLTFDGQRVWLVRDGVNQPVSTREAFILTADGRVRFLADGISEELLKKLVTINGGESVPEF